MIKDRICSHFSIRVMCYQCERFREAIHVLRELTNAMRVYEYSRRIVIDRWNAANQQLLTRLRVYPRVKVEVVLCTNVDVCYLLDAFPRYDVFGIHL